MKLSTLKNLNRDGRLVVVSRDLASGGGCRRYCRDAAGGR